MRQVDKMQQPNGMGMSCSMTNDCIALGEGRTLTVSGKPCAMEDIVVEDDDACRAALDAEGDVCANDGTSREAYCSYLVGPQTCARCTNTIDLAPSDSEHFVLMTVMMPYSKSDFNLEKQNQFKAAVANAAGTYSGNLQIVSITEKSRRAGSSVDVETKIRAKDEAGMDAVMTTLGSGDALKSKIDGALQEQGLEPSAAVTAPTKASEIVTDISAAGLMTPMWALAFALQACTALAL